MPGSVDKARAVIHRRQLEVRRETLPDVRHGGAPAERSCRHPWSAHEHWHVLARVVAAGPGRVTAVIGAQDCNVAWAEPREEGRHARVKILERGGISFHVPAM